MQSERISFGAKILEKEELNHAVEIGLEVLK